MRCSRAQISLLFASLLATAALASAHFSPAASAKAPYLFLGMNAEDIYSQTDDYQWQQLNTVRDIGVTTMRQSFRWGYTEPERGVYDWAKLDRYVLATARHGMRVQPLVYGETRWATSRPAGNQDECTYPPRNSADYGEFARQIALRYGRGGSFWKQWPMYASNAVTAYELWNEPNLKRFWACKPNATDYVRLARYASDAIRSVDPQATIISAGAPKKNVDTGKYFKAMVKAGAPQVFNAMGLHSYRAHSNEVLDDLEVVRDALDDRELNWPIYLTEWGWPTGGPESKYTTTESGQAAAVRHALEDFGAHRKRLKLKSVVYYSWADLPPPPGSEDYWGLHTGLLRIDLSRKPALQAFKDAGAKIK